MLAFGIGCQNNNGGDGGGTMNQSADACTHCAGAQTAKADGTCPACGMKVR